jgi:hypothetical protein
MTILNQKAGIVRSPVSASIARTAVMENLYRDMEATIAVSSKQGTTLSKSRLISISRVNLMSLGVRATMICGDRT